jgi:glycerol-3-phosphate dehydrogenase subunit C
VALVFDPVLADGWVVFAVPAPGGVLLKFEGPLMVPEIHAVGRLAAAARDVSEYVVELSRAHGLTEGLQPVAGGVTLHHACHARAQNMGAKSAEMLRLIPDTEVSLVERCSGHGGTFGVMKKTHAVARKVGRPAARQVAAKGAETLCSDCPLACKHLGQLLEAETAPEASLSPRQEHPIEVMARAYGVF